ncbi:substrate-binding periplasmic protein [Zooshikella sp. RANM57]|uniref:substrate-binding periplasmic protein n=1 Tax=Zooshikella sp. RANM57 TaxID=3425863 RepID=UPI003D6F4A66
MKLLAALCLFCTIFSVETQAYALSIAVAEWPPYYSKNNINDSIQQKRISDVLNRQHIKHTFIWLNNWVAVYNQTLAGKFDISAGWICNEERAKDYYFSFPISVIDQYFFHLKEYPFDWNSYEDLKAHQPFGITTGYDYGNEFADAVKKYSLELKKVRIERLVFNLLLKKRVNVVPLNVENAMSILERYYSKQDAEKITFHAKPYQRSYLHIIVSKSNPQAAQILRLIYKLFHEQNDVMGKKVGTPLVSDVCPKSFQKDWVIN